MYHLVEKVVKPAVYSFYSNETFCTKGAQQQTNECSWRQLTYGQWATGLITDRPMAGMQEYIQTTEYKEETSHSYARLYKNLSMLSLPGFTPEISYY
jgi:hypothetical protein